MTARRLPLRYLPTGLTFTTCISLRPLTQPPEDDSDEDITIYNTTDQGTINILGEVYKRRLTEGEPGELSLESRKFALDPLIEIPDWIMNLVKALKEPFREIVRCIVLVSLVCFFVCACVAWSSEMDGIDQSYSGLDHFCSESFKDRIVCTASMITFDLKPLDHFCFESFNASRISVLFQSSRDHFCIENFRSVFL